MTRHPLNLSTLAWLDRKRIWATANRKTSLGPSAIDTTPTTLSGQSSKVNTVLRTFTLPYPWLLSSLGVGLGAGLAVFNPLALWAYLAAHLKRVVFAFDASFGSQGPELGLKPIDMAAPLRGEDLNAPLEFSFLLYSLLGAIDPLQRPSLPVSPTHPLLSCQSWEGGLTLPQSAI